MRVIIPSSLKRYCSHEDERGDGSLRVLQASTATTHGIADSLDGLVLSDDTAVELLFEVEQLFALALHHAGYGDARPAGDDLGDVVGGDLFADEAGSSSS